MIMFNSDVIDWNIPIIKRIKGFGFNYDYKRRTFLKILGNSCLLIKIDKNYVISSARNNLSIDIINIHN
jgi:hypothetical protein